MRSLERNLKAHRKEYLLDLPFNIPRYRPTIGRAYALIEVDRIYYQRRYGKSHPYWQYGFEVGTDYQWVDGAIHYPQV